MSSLPPPRFQAERDILAVPTNTRQRSESRPHYPGGPRRVLPVNTVDSCSAPDGDNTRHKPWTLPAFSHIPAKVASATDTEATGQAGKPPRCATLSNSPRRVAFEEWLVKACAEASIPQQTVSGSASGSPKPTQPPRCGAEVDKCSGEMAALILKACLEEAGVQGPAKVDAWLTRATSEEGQSRDCRKTSPPSSESDVSMDAFAVNSSDNSDAYSTAGSSVGTASEANSEPSTARNVDLPTVSGQSAQGTASPAVCTSLAPTNDQSSTPLKRTNPELERKGGLTLSSIATALAYPWLAAGAAANSAIETLGCALALFEDEEWGDRAATASLPSEPEYSSSDDSVSGYGEIFPKGKPSIQAIIPGRVGLRGRLQALDEVPAQMPNKTRDSKVKAKHNNGINGSRKGDSWEDVLRKRRAAKAFARFLDQTRGQLVANRLYIPEMVGPTTPLWKRRGFSNPASILLALRRGAIPCPAPKEPSLPLMKAMEVQASPATAASPIWQRRAVGPPTPLTMARRKAPEPVARPRQLPNVRVH